MTEHIDLIGEDPHATGTQPTCCQCSKTTPDMSICSECENWTCEDCETELQFDMSVCHECEAATVRTRFATMQQQINEYRDQLQRLKEQEYSPLTGSNDLPGDTVAQCGKDRN